MLFLIFSVDNVAYRKNATQSSTSWKWDASRAVDGNRNSRWWTTCTRTRRERNAWWRVDLGESLPVHVVNIVSGRGTLRNFKISVGDVDDPNTNPL